MHFVISGTWADLGPTEPTRANLPFLFAASAVERGDSVTLMLFHDALLMAVAGVDRKRVPVGPPNRYEEVVGHPKVLDVPAVNEFYAAAKQANAQVVAC